MVFAKTLSGAVVGLEASLVEVQCDVARGLPGFVIVGLPDKEVQESRERIRSAIKNSGYEFPAKRITANLAPADLRKEGVGLDLPLALAILAATGQLELPQEDLLFLGSMAHSGRCGASCRSPSRRGRPGCRGSSSPRGTRSRPRSSPGWTSSR